MGFCAAIRTASFLADWSGAFSLFCCGPQTLARSHTSGRDALDHVSTLVQMQQLKPTNTTTGFLEKDIKSMTKLNFTIPRDFHELARLLKNMAGAAELLFGPGSPLTQMLDKWHPFLTRAVGSTQATLRQLAHEDSSVACRLGWFIEKRMQQYLVLCAGVEHKDDINPNLLDFRSTREQLEDGAFVFPACDFLKDRMAIGGNSAKAEAPAAATGGGTGTGRRGQPADAVVNPQQDLFLKDANDNWQVFLDHMRSGLIPNMCCRWHLYGKCIRSCFLSASHVALTTKQTASRVRAWIEQCRARMRRPSSDSTPPDKKTKLEQSASAYTRISFFAQPSRWSFDHESAHRAFHNRQLTENEQPFRDAGRTPRRPEAFALLAIPAAQPRPPPTNAMLETPLAAEASPRAARSLPIAQPGFRSNGAAPAAARLAPTQPASSAPDKRHA